MQLWKIWTIIVLMSISLIGIAITQIYWIRSAITLEEKNFDTKVFKALNEVKSQIDISIQNSEAIGTIAREIIQKENKKYLDEFSKSSNQWRQAQILNETKSLAYSLNPEIFLENLKPDEINENLKVSFQNQGIDLKYDYGIYSDKYKDFIIINDHYVSPTKTRNVSASNEENNNLDKSKYNIQLLTTEFKSPGSLKLLFKNRTEKIWFNVLPQLFMNLIFTLLILFAFSYTIYVILRQKKITQMKTDFVNNMTHEFKTPIATITIATDAILNPVKINDPEWIKKFAGIIREENSRLLNHVEQILNIAKLDKRKIELNLSELNINEIIDESTDHLALKIDNKNCHIIKNYKTVDPSIKADETHMINIFINLIDNALKYSSDNPEVKITTENKDNGIEIEITDNGIGMTNEESRNIFESFYRVSTGNVHNIKGFGLGLAYVKAFVEAHRGTISVKSIKNKGTKFKLFFPKL